ncbi:REP element-mobilizing transposase RayT [Prosthecobacter debontii]|uniref:REP element-mobilizing transposase RayT n=1 Tax=Prosthecobacter debontii TaxID=48467 RepID=A0A1T4YK53_9BACT|nr:IS200/IS605 family transposase [Prosthecobacter debontii]SKB02063.1 REP element-mobilizing transposase RayT [Prosthecobacter debontii]
MADSFHSLTYHLIWSTKNRTACLSEMLQPRLWEYLAGIAHQKKMQPLCVGGWFDHVHALVRLPPNLDVSKAIQWLKGPSSKWLHETFPHELGAFEWQDGYGAFSVSQSQVGEVFEYIKNQRQHHRTKTFQEEFVAFLERHGIEWKPEYIWG